MRPTIDLFILRDSLLQLSENTYFSAQLHEFAGRLTDAVIHVIDQTNYYGPDVVREFAAHVRGAHRYLSGSTISEAPYEMEYCLRAALGDWLTRDCIITTALTADQDFHFRPTDPWDFVKRAITKFDTAGYDPLLVQLGVPGLYKHKPIFCIPLYHELGHFIDTTFGVTRLSLLTNPAVSLQMQPIEWRHRQEHFCDLFAASYVGRSSIQTLETIAPGAGASFTHPATSSRIAVVNAFMNNLALPIIDILQSCLFHLTGRRITISYKAPDICSDFDDIRPHRIADTAGLHGLFDSSWNYLTNALDNSAAPWINASMKVDEIERIVNDLTEKSIRNKALKERWVSGNTP